jgi:hypothetical protein
VESVKSEVNRIIDEVLERDQPALPAWIIQELITRHADVHGEDAAWHVTNSRAHLANVVRGCVNATKGGASTPDQLLLPGHEYLQLAYCTMRNDEPCIVPIGQMSGDEIEAKATELEGMSAGCLKHAGELRRYAQDRLHTQPHSNSR